MHSEGIAAIYLPGEGAVKTVCLTLHLTKPLYTREVHQSLGDRVLICPWLSTLVRNC